MIHKANELKLFEGMMSGERQFVHAVSLKHAKFLLENRLRKKIW